MAKSYTHAHTCNCAGHALIADIIDFEQEDDGMMIHYNICSQLDELKLTYHGLPSLLTKVVESELQVLFQSLTTEIHLPESSAALRVLKSMKTGGATKCS